VVASVVTTRGCKHRCRHCPVVPIYNGRFYAIPAATVMDDIRQVVGSGAEHISFGDPDFLNGPAHARRVARALHDEFPSVTFDFTAKIEHLVHQRSLVRELQEMGCVLVVSAVESLSDRVLAALDKGHSADDVRETVRFFKAFGLALRPTLIPFTPWETLDTLESLTAFVSEEDMFDHVEPVQFTIRLLVPPGSVLATSTLMRPYLGALERENFTYPWSHPDARMDALHRRLLSVVATADRQGEDPVVTMSHIADEVALAAGRPVQPSAVPLGARFPSDRLRPPRLTETGFC
jgi:pyruvate-formate lyase-activating enzyme